VSETSHRIGIAAAAVATAEPRYHDAAAGVAQECEALSSRPLHDPFLLLPVTSPLISSAINGASGLAHPNRTTTTRTK
jgi:hypothetical protein